MKPDRFLFNSKTARILFLCFLSIFILLGLLLAFLPAELTIGLLNPLSPDGKIESLTIPLVHQVQPIALVLSCILLVIFMVFFIKKDLFAQILQWMNRQWLVFRKDTKQTLSVIWKHMHNRQLWIDVLFVFSLALILRFMKLERPLEHDEAFTYYVFARLPWRYAIADYSIPNNHVFHTILLKASVAIFGNQTWAIRLPVYLFGAAIAPMLYLFARYTTHKRSTSLLAGGFAALFPYMILTSVNARGYSMMAFFTVLAALLTDDMMKHKNRFLWSCFSLVIVLGLWTLPIMLLPAGGLYLWILWLGMRHQHDPAYGKWGWLKYAIASGILIIIGTILVYLPVIIYSGINSLIANPYVSALSYADFLPTLSDRLKDTWHTLQNGFPLYVALPAVLIMLLAFFHPQKKVRDSSGVIPAFFIFLVIYCAVLKPNLWPRVTFYLVPFYMLALAYGFSALKQWIGRNWNSTPIVFGLVLLFAIFSLISAPNYSPIGKQHLIETKQQAQWLSQNWQNDQIILIDYPEDMAFSVYSEQYGMPASAIRWEHAFRGAYIITNKPEKQTIESVIKEHGPELYFFNLEQAQIIQDYTNSTLYYVPSNWELVEAAYQ